jgi:hypothetical protein
MSKLIFMPQPWMLFQACHPNNHRVALDLYYFWNGTWAVLVREGEGLPTEQTGWTGKTALDLEDREIEFLNAAAADKRKKTFKLPRNQRQYRIVTRGIFDSTE